MLSLTLVKILASAADTPSNIVLPRAGRIGQSLPGPFRATRTGTTWKPSLTGLATYTKGATLAACVTPAKTMAAESVGTWNVDNFVYRIILYLLAAYGLFTLAKQLGGWLISYIDFLILQEMPTPTIATNAAEPDPEHEDGVDQTTTSPSDDYVYWTDQQMLDYHEEYGHSSTGDFIAVTDYKLSDADYVRYAVLTAPCETCRRGENAQQVDMGDLAGSLAAAEADIVDYTAVPTEVHVVAAAACQNKYHLYDDCRQLSGRGSRSHVNKHLVCQTCVDRTPAPIRRVVLSWIQRGGYRYSEQQTGSMEASSLRCRRA